MLILGYYGGPSSEYDLDSPPPRTHDGAAVLLRDGEVVAAIEEERLNRIKHSDTAPTRAVQFVLDQAGATLADVDHIAIPFRAEFANRLLQHRALESPTASTATDVVELLREKWLSDFGADVPRTKLHFVRHHLAHAMSAFSMSGFGDALTLTLDGQGETEAGLVLSGKPTGLDILRTIQIPNSLGHFYMRAIGFLGYQLFDEYKVMGLAPYGDAGRFRSLFNKFYDLLEDGGWQLYPDRLLSLYEKLTPRRKGEPIEQIHKDIAASLQEMLERTVLHLLKHFRNSTGHRNLCMGGGVAHNCTMNGKLLSSGLFDDVFVQPAAHDAGNALGAALLIQRRFQGSTIQRRLRDVYWGSDIGDTESLRQTLQAWSIFIEANASRDVENSTADLLASGKVVGWVQGRSEFGPRALGNRSILADPRPAENKAIINQMVKKRESFQPFAPAVLVEDAAEYFDVPPGTSELPFMIFVLPVKTDRRALLGAVTHIDGTARVQTVARDTNPRFWGLINAFKERTGVPVVLNTSFNNNVEPIVDSPEDAIACFLTTGLQALVIGDFVVHKKEASTLDYQHLVLWLPKHVRLIHTRQRHPAGELRDTYELGRATWAGELRTNVSEDIFEILQRADGRIPLASLLQSASITGSEQVLATIDTFLDLWSRRYVLLRPPSSA